jgi:hypothetical protein
MRKIFISSFLFLTLNSFAQDYLSVSLAKSFSSFNFTNSEGQKDKTIKTVSKNAYAINYMQVLDTIFFVRVELGAKEMGAYSVLNNEKITWNLNYVDVNWGGGFIMSVKKAKVYLGASFYGSYLLNANQTIGVNYYDMKKNNSIKKNDFGVNAFLGTIYPISTSTFMVIECAKSFGLNQLDASSNQKLFNKAIFIKLGLTFRLKALKKNS